MAKQENDLETSSEESINRVRRDLDKRIDEIKTDLRQKPKSVEELEETLEGLRVDVERKISEAQQYVDHQLESSRREIRRHPLMAVGIAALVGLIIGMLLGRESRR